MRSVQPAKDRKHQLFPIWTAGNMNTYTERNRLFSLSQLSLCVGLACGSLGAERRCAGGTSAGTHDE